MHQPTPSASSAAEPVPSPNASTHARDTSVVVIDDGPMDGAIGDLRTSDDGRQVYIVGSGDYTLAISLRFGVDLDQLGDADAERIGYTERHPGDEVYFYVELVGLELDCFQGTPDDMSVCRDLTD